MNFIFLKFFLIVYFSKTIICDSSVMIPLGVMLVNHKIQIFWIFRNFIPKPQFNSQDRTPRVRFRPLPGFYVFPAGWKCQPEGEDIGSGCCEGGVIQLRLRERALLRQGQLSEPQASSGPAAMLLAISQNLSCIPRRSPCPGRYPLPLAYLFLSPLTEP